MKAILFLLRFNVNGESGGELIEVPLIAIELVDRTSKKRNELLARAGHGEGTRHIMLANLEENRGATAIDPERWGGWAMTAVHEALYARMNDFKDGCVFNANNGEITS